MTRTAVLASAAAFAQQPADWQSLRLALGGNSAAGSFHPIGHSERRQESVEAARPQRRIGVLVGEVEVPCDLGVELEIGPQNELVARVVASEIR